MAGSASSNTTKPKIVVTLPGAQKAADTSPQSQPPAAGGEMQDLFAQWQAMFSPQQQAPAAQQQVSQVADDSIGCYWLGVLPPALAALGFPALAPGLIYQKGDNLFSQSTHILTQAYGSQYKDVEIIDDEDWTQFPEVAQEVKQKTGWEYSVAIGISKTLKKWGVGISAGVKGRASAAKLALAVSICMDNPALMASTEEYYPGFVKMCLTQGILQQQQPAPAAAAPKKRKAPQEWTDWSEWGNKDKHWTPTPESPPPKLDVIKLAATSSLVQLGLPDTGIGMVWTKKNGWFYYNTERIFKDIVGNPELVTIQDDPDWTMLPEIGAALAPSGVEENHYCVAISTVPYCWGVGLAGSPVGREIAAKMALSIRMMDAQGKTEEILKKYTELQHAIKPQA